MDVPAGPAPAEFYAALPRKRMAAGALFFDANGQLLVVKPTYRDGWLVPGGTIEADESPRAGCDREIGEELGLRRAVRRLACVEWCSALAPQNESVMFLFDGGMLDAEEIAAIRLPPNELEDHRFIPPDEAPAWLPARLARRVTVTLAAPPGSTVYLDDGVPLT